MHTIFKSNIYLELLNLAECKVSGGEISILCDNLSENQSIKYLYLRNNDLGEIGAESMARLILVNKSMIELDLFNCNINSKGGNKIGTSLKSNFCIEKFSIGDN